jgi:hypothetical protein
MKLNRSGKSRSPASAGSPRRRKPLIRQFYGVEALESRQLLSLFTFFPARWPYVRRPAAPPVVKAQPAPKAPSAPKAPTISSTTTTTTTTTLSAPPTQLIAPPVTPTAPAAQPTGMTLLSQENFTSNVSANAPDAFDSVTGTLFSEVGGPNTPATAGTIGVSADPEQPGPSFPQSTNTITANWNLTSGSKAASAQDSGFIGGWFLFKFTDTDSYPGHVADLMTVSSMASLDLNTNDQLQVTPTGAPIGTVPLNQWVFLGLAWNYVPNTEQIHYQIYSNLPGQPLTLIYTATPIGFPNAPTTASLVDHGDQWGGGFGRWEGRVGTFFIASINSFSDVATPTTIVAPVIQKLYFGADPVNGNDNNSGIIIPVFAADGKTVIGFAPGSSPWKTLERVNTALTYSGLFSQTVAWINTATGTPADESQSATTLQAEIAAGTIERNPLISELVIDTASAPFSVAGSGGIDATGGIQLDTNINLSGFGSNVGSMTDVGSLSDFIPISKSAWTLAPGATLTYETTNTSLNSVLWQDRRWMNHIEGSTFSSVEAQLEATPGSFWTDGTTMYVHPFANTNPGTDASVYERSPGGTYSNGIGILVNISDCYIHNLAIGGTTGADMNTGDPIGLYCIGSGDTGTGGLNLFANLYLYYSSKHALGWTDGASNERMIVFNVDGEQGSPYAGFGGQYSFVNFNGNLTASGNQVLYLDCRATDSAGLIGSTTGQQLTVGTYYNHNGGGSGQFSEISFINCNFDGGIIGGDATVNLNVTNTVCAEIDSSAINLTADGDTTFTNIIRGPGTVTNSIMKSPIIYGIGSGSHLFSGTTSYIGDVFDGRGAAVWNQPSYFFLDGPASLTIRDCVFLATAKFPVIDEFTSGDQIVFDHNLYDTEAGIEIATDFNSISPNSTYSLAQWQAAGYDTGSIAVADSAMNINLTNYIPFAQTPITFDLGQMDDMTGSLFFDRKTIGAFEFVPSLPIYSPPAGSGLSTPGSFMPSAGTGLN